jgi:hypothetical protein
LLWSPGYVKVDPNAYAKREKPHKRVKHTKTLELLRAVFEEPAQTVEQGGMRLLLEGVSRGEEEEVLESPASPVEERELESPASPVDEQLDSPTSPTSPKYDQDASPGGFVTQNLALLGLDGSEQEEEDKPTQAHEAVEVVQTPPLRRSSRLKEKRKASKENGGEVKRRR